MNNLRGEFEIEVLGKKVGCMLTLNALRMFSQAEGVKLEEFDKFLKSDPLDSLPMLAYYGYLNKRLKTQAKGKSVPKELFVSEVLDSNDIELVAGYIADAMNNDLDKGKSGNVKGAK